MRYVSIDILRTAAIVLMVVVHFLENLAGGNWNVAGFGAPLFTFLAGVSYRLWVNGLEAKGVDDETISKRSVRRGLFLFALGVAFNVLVWLPEDTFNWDVLTLIGTGLLLLNVVRNLPLAVPVVMGLVAFLLGPVLRELADYPAHWVNGYFECDLALADVLVGFLATGYFPVFPWIVYPLAGFVTGSVFFTDEPGAVPPTGRAALIGAGLVGLSLAALALRAALPDPVPTQVLRGWTMFPPSVEYVTGTVGLALLLFSLGHRWIDPAIKGRPLTGLLAVATTFSRHSLTMYLFHHAAHLWPLWLYGAAIGTEPTQFWREAVAAEVALLLSGCCLLAGYVLCRWMDRTERAGIEGWMRHLCD
ncbi:MAG TPA: heparan-alpha-glucosaminide N-acetyltransferase domain-containing protein [Gemmata sp.]